MLKEFAQYLVSLKDNKTYNIHGDTYSDHDLVRIKPHIDRPANLSVSGLDSIVKLVRNELDMFENLPVFIRVDDARTVSVFTTYDDMMCRDSLYTAKCDVPGFRDGFREYEQALRQRRRMDYDDQMVYALRILRQYPQILEEFQKRYQYFCVDEAQDTSRIQHRIIRLLAGQSRNLFLVGDEDQSIYGFRAADPSALIRFPEDWPGARVLRLERNYRSTHT